MAVVSFAVGSGKKILSEETKIRLPRVLLDLEHWAVPLQLTEAQSQQLEVLADETGITVGLKWHDSIEFKTREFRPSACKGLEAGVLLCAGSSDSLALRRMLNVLLYRSKKAGFPFRNWKRLDASDKDQLIKILSEFLTNDEISRTQSEERKRAAWALGKIGDPVAREPLLKALRHDGPFDSCGVSLAIGDALGRIGDPRDMEPLLAAYLVCSASQEKGAQRMGFERALHKLGLRSDWEMRKGVSKDNIREDIIRWCSSPHSEETRSLAAVALIGLNYAPPFNWLMRVCCGDSFQRVWPSAVARFKESLVDEQLLPEVVLALKGSPLQDLLQKCAERIAEKTDASMKNFLLKLVFTSDWFRWGTPGDLIEAIVRFEDPSAIEAAVQYLLEQEELLPFPIEAKVLLHPLADQGFVSCLTKHPHLISRRKDRLKRIVECTPGLTRTRSLFMEWSKKEQEEKEAVSREIEDRTEKIRAEFSTIFDFERSGESEAHCGQYSVEPRLETLDFLVRHKMAHVLQKERAISSPNLIGALSSLDNRSAAHHANEILIDKLAFETARTTLAEASFILSYLAFLRTVIVNLALGVDTFQDENLARLIAVAREMSDSRATDWKTRQELKTLAGQLYSGIAAVKDEKRRQETDQLIRAYRTIFKKARLPQKLSSSRTIDVPETS